MTPGPSPAILRAVLSLIEECRRDGLLVLGLCGAQGCRARLDAPGPYNLMTIDYGHLSPEGSLFVARAVLRDALDAGETSSGFRGAALRRAFD